MKESSVITAVQGTGFGGAVVTSLIMLFGPWLGASSLPALTVLASVVYPLLLFLTTFVETWGLRATLVMSLVALGCVAVVVAPYAVQESPLTLLWIWVIVGLPAIFQVINIGSMLRAEAKNEAERRR